MRVLTLGIAAAAAALVLAACSSSESFAISQTCHGAPFPCEGRDVTTCNANLGCTEMPACTGIASDCAFISTTVSTTACTNQEGCHWDEADNVCAGVATSCSLATSCATQAGCTVESAVRGSALRVRHARRGRVLQPARLSVGDERRDREQGVRRHADRVRLASRRTMRERPGLRAGGVQRLGELVLDVSRLPAVLVPAGMQLERVGPGVPGVGARVLHLPFFRDVQRTVPMHLAVDAVLGHCDDRLREPEREPLHEDPGCLLQ